jgi:nitrogen fixation protein FixH
LSGAVARNHLEASIALLQQGSVQRRFSAARAIFTAWTAGQEESRFLTSAVTRDQQASRAFAAELTAPYALLRARARQSKLTQDQVFDLAAELQIGSDVVSKQALNNGLQVRPV